MCFSATASFGAAVLLGGVGIVTLRKVSDKSDIMFAATPVLFAVQQAAEGVLWLTIDRPQEAAAKAAMWVFLFFAQVLWPAWIPFAMWNIEKDRRRRKFISITCIAGVLCASLLAYRMFTFPVAAEIHHHHIYYTIGSSRGTGIVSSVLYMIATIVPPFLSSVRHMKVLGILLAVSLLFTKLFYENYLISVWCFFGAFVSFFVIHVMNALSRRWREV